MSNDCWVQLLELLNKVCDLGFEIASRSLGGAYKKRGQVWFRRVDRACGVRWRSSVVLHDIIGC